MPSRRSPSEPKRRKRKRAASPATVQGQRRPRIARVAQLTETEKLQLAIRYALLPVCMEGVNKGKKIGVGALEERRMVGRGYIAKHLDIYGLLRAKPDESPLQRQERSDKGTVRKWTPEVRAALAAKAEEWNHTFTYEEMALYLKEAGHTISTVQLWRKMGDDRWNGRARARTVPLLTEAHRDARVSYAQEMLDEDWSAHVDIDEKWWYSMCPWRTHKVPEGKLVPLTGIQHKNHIPKVMHLSVLARPRWDEEGNCVFDGKIGTWRVSEPYTAKRDSRYHKKGDIYEKDVTMNSERYVDLMIEIVLPAIADAFRPFDVPQVVVQHDGAPPHVGHHAELLIDEFGATLTPPIKIKRQPSQSPDTNICDLAFFRALGAQVAKRRRGIEKGHTQFDLEQLSTDVMKAFADYSPETLDSMWAYKSEIMRKIIEASGGNWYDKRRGTDAQGKKRVGGQ